MSNITIYRFALDMTPGGVTPVVHLSQYDEAFQLEFTLYSRSGELDIPSGATAMIEGTKLDGKAYSANANISGNVVTVAGDVQISAVAGNNPFQIVLKSGNSTVGSANFTISVERAAMDYDTVSDSKLAQIQDVTATAAQLTAAAENVTDGVETFEALAESLSDMLADITDDTLSITDKAADAAAVGNALAAEIAPKYSTTGTYAVGDYVLYNNALYRCNTAIATAESWTAAHWTAVKIGSELGNLKSDLNALKDSRYGYYSKHFTIASGASHSSNDDMLFVDIQAGEVFNVTVTGVSSPQIYARYIDGTNARLTIGSTYTGSSNKEIVSIGIYSASTSADRNVTITVTLKKSIYTTVTEEVPEIVKNVDRTNEVIHVLGTEFTEKINPKFEYGRFDNTDGSEIDSDSWCRMVDYIATQHIACFYCGSRSGALYCYGYTYENGAYVYNTKNQITSTGDLTTWLKKQSYSHFRLAWENININQAPNWLDIKLKTSLEKISAVEKIDFGRINKAARELLISILQNSVYNANVSQKITMLERQLYESGELVIIATGKRYAQSGSTSTSENHCITDYYPIPEGETTIVIYMAVDDLTKLGNPFILFHTDDDKLSYCVNMSNSGRQNAEYAISVASTSKYVGFTLITESAQKSYAYFLNSGNLIFAGSQSKYGGLKNIIQKGGDA